MLKDKQQVTLEKCKQLIRKDIDCHQLLIYEDMIRILASYREEYRLSLETLDEIVKYIQSYAEIAFVPDFMKNNIKLDIADQELYDRYKVEHDQNIIMSEVKKEIDQFFQYYCHQKTIYADNFIHLLFIIRDHYALTDEMLDKVVNYLRNEKKISIIETPEWLEKELSLDRIDDKEHELYKRYDHVIDRYEEEMIDTIKQDDEDNESH